MEAHLEIPRSARDIKTGEDVVIMEAGTRVEVGELTPAMVRIAEGEPFAGMWLPRRDVLLLLTVEEVAARTNRTPETVRRWLKDETLVGVKVSGRGTGGQWRVPLSAVEGFTAPKPGPKGGK